MAPNEALADFAASIVKVQVPVPVQAPLQPAKLLPADGLAVSVTLVLALKFAEQVAPQSIPAGLLVTVPEPLPDLATLRAKGPTDCPARTRRTWMPKPKPSSTLQTKP